MRTLLTCGALLLILNAGQAQTPVNNEYTFPEGFKARFESKPKVEQTVLKTKAGEQKITTVTSSRSSDLILSVSYSDLPDSGTPLEVEKVYESTVRAMSKNGKQIEERTLEAKDPTPAGKELLMVHGKITTRARLYLDGRRLFVVSAVGSASKVQDKAAEALLQHFAIVPRTQD